MHLLLAQVAIDRTLEFTIACGNFSISTPVITNDRTYHSPLVTAVLLKSWLAISRFPTRDLHRTLLHTVSLFFHASIYDHDPLCYRDRRLTVYYCIGLIARCQGETHDSRRSLDERGSTPLAVYSFKAVEPGREETRASDQSWPRLDTSQL